MTEYNDWVEIKTETILLIASIKHFKRSELHSEHTIKENCTQEETTN